MPFEKVLVTASIAQAVATIPGAIKAIRDLFVESQPEHTAANQQLDALCCNIRALAEAGRWLEEAKYMHEYLQHLDTSMQPVAEEYARAIDDGRFDFQKYRPSVVRKCWRLTRSTFLNKLLSFSTQIRHVEEQPLIYAPPDQFVSGPDWAKKYLDLLSKIEGHFVKYDNGAPADVLLTSHDIADATNEFVEHTKALMHHIDQRIRNEASDFAHHLSKLRGDYSA